MKYFVGLLPFILVALLVALVVSSVVRKIRQQRAIEQKIKELQGKE